METRYYRPGEFAKRAGVSVRTLRYYDQFGLLCPEEHTVSGHRRYADKDLLTLSRIIGLKQLGFHLNEIRAILRSHPETLGEHLERQRRTLEEQRQRLEQALTTIREVQANVHAGTWDWNSVLRVVEVMNMNEDRTWAEKHLSADQLNAIKEISNRAYSTEAYNRLRDRTWTEEDQQKATAEWNEVYADAERLSKAGSDPESPEGLELGKRYRRLIEAFTMNDPEVESGLRIFYAEAKSLPAEKSPFGNHTWEAMDFAQRAYEAHLKRT